MSVTAVQEGLWEPPRHPLDIAADPYRRTNPNGRQILLCPSCGGHYGDQLIALFELYHAPWEQPDCATIRRHRDTALIHLRSGNADGWRWHTAQLRLAGRWRQTRTPPPEETP